jgi:hypothetical protein
MAAEDSTARKSAHNQAVMRDVNEEGRPWVPRGKRASPFATRQTAERRSASKCAGDELSPAVPRAKTSTQSSKKLSLS